jgi:putative endonuclease
MKTGYIYIMSNVKRNVFYIGVTSDLEERVAQHKEGIGRSFTSKYSII